MIPAIPQSILAILGAAATALAAWYLNKKIMPWIQKWQSGVDTSSNTVIRKQSDSLNQKQNDESDKLKEIEGR